jgi:hypothetical protein
MFLTTERNSASKAKKNVNRAGRCAGRAAALAVAALVFASAGFAQTPANQTPDQTGTAAPGTAPMATHQQAVALAPGRLPRYDNKWEAYVGLSFMNGQAGQNLPKRYNMGGGEGMITRWISPHLGLTGDYRIEAGTTPILPSGSAYGLNRVEVYQNIFAGGVQYRGPKNRYVAINYHAFAGATHGTFDTAITGYPPNSPSQPTTELVGLYSNRTSPWGAAGGSIDFNQGPHFAVRLSPDIIFEHFGTETREYVSVSLGVLYRFGKK